MKRSPGPARSLFGIDDLVPHGPAADVETVRRVAAALERLDPRRAKLVAGVAFLLTRVAVASPPASDEETRAMERIVHARMRLPEPEAVLAVEVAKIEARLLGVTERLLVSRELTLLLPRASRIRLVEGLYAIAAADGRIDAAEEEEIHKIAAELKLERRDVAAARAALHPAALPPDVTLEGDGTGGLTGTGA